MPDKSTAAFNETVGQIEESLQRHCRQPHAPEQIR